MSEIPLLKGKMALVTGGSQGLGLASAQQLALHGARVGILDLDLEKAESVLASLEGNGHRAYRCDVTAAEERERAISEAQHEFGRIDILVNNAGIQYHSDAESMDEAEWNRVVNVNLNAVMFISSFCARYMIAQKAGAIVNIGSISSFFGMPRRSVYVATKTAILGLTRALATEWGCHHIRVNAVCPGYHQTPLYKEYVDNGTLKPEKIIARIPMKRLGLPEDVGKAVVMLCSPLADYITGQAIMVDGGYTIYGAP